MLVRVAAQYICNDVRPRAKNRFAHRFMGWEFNSSGTPLTLRGFRNLRSFPGSRSNCNDVILPRSITALR